jgi:hypothetical protein
LAERLTQHAEVGAAACFGGIDAPRIGEAALSGFKQPKDLNDLAVANEAELDRGVIPAQ